MTMKFVIAKTYEVTLLCRGNRELRCTRQLLPFAIAALEHFATKFTSSRLESHTYLLAFARQRTKSFRRTVDRFLPAARQLNRADTRSTAAPEFDADTIRTMDSLPNMVDSIDGWIDA